MKPRKQAVVFSILFLLLVLPPMVYFYVTRGFNTFIKLEVIGQEDHKIADFSFINQNNEIVVNDSLKDNIYIANFFFTSCPTICPIMSANMLTLYDDFKGEPNLNFLSHTIDTRHDSVKVLKRYSTKLGVSSDRWHFVTGPKDDIYGIAKSYLVSAKEDKNSPGGYIHSGALILVDGQGRIRAYYDGTKEEDIVKMKRAIKAILSQ